MAAVKIVTFNVNGLRSLKDDYMATKKWSFDQLLDSFQADIICFQETKINKADMVDHDLAFPKSYHAYFAFPRVPRKTGYSGVVTYIKNTCIHQVRSFMDGFARPEVLEDPDCQLNELYDPETLERLDSESRVMMTDHGAFTLFNVYFPNDGGPERAEFRERFYSAITLRFQELAKRGKNVIVVCDLNTTYLPIDHCDYVKPYLEIDSDAVDSVMSEYAKKLVTPHLNNGRLLMESLHDLPASFDISKLDPSVPALLQEYFMTKPCRLWAHYHFRLTSKFVDCYRVHHLDEPNRFTCWNTLMAARGSNYGTRIDYIIGLGPAFADEESIRSHVTGSDQMYDFMGSDHCPVWTEFKFEVVPWNPTATEAKQGKPAVLNKQPRLDSFFKPVKKSEKTDEEKQRSDVLIEEPKGKRAKSFVDTRLPFAKASLDSPPPLCTAHQEPSKQFTVNKAGPNKGRKFYVCSRPVGHPTDPQAKCSFFKWY